MNNQVEVDTFGQIFRTETVPSKGLCKFNHFEYKVSHEFQSIVKNLK